MLARTLCRLQSNSQVSTAAATQRPLQQLLEWSSRLDFARAAELLEAKWLAPARKASSSTSSRSLPALVEFAQTPIEARDVSIVAMRVFTSLGQMEHIRDAFAFAVEDLAAIGALNATVFDAYLEILTKRKQFSKEEVNIVLNTMQSYGIDRTPHTYLYLAELHVRMGLDPSGLYQEELQQHSLDHHKAEEASPSSSFSGGGGGGESTTYVLPAFARMMFSKVAPVTTDMSLAVRIVRHMLLADRLDRSQFGEVVASWLCDPLVAPEHAVWLLFEFEQRCVLERVTLTNSVHKHHLLHTMLRAARCGDVQSVERLLSFMDRHVIQKTSDVLALAVVCYANAEALEKAFDTVELMSRKGFLELAEVFKPLTIDALNYTLDRHFLMILADVMRDTAAIQRAMQHLTHRRSQRRSVSVHSLDTVVLACSKIGDEVLATQTLDTYLPAFGVAPRTQSFNSVFLASISPRKTVSHRALYERMVKENVAPNAQTFRVLIRHAVSSNDIDEAVRYLESVPAFSSLRIEIEMILPIIERAARAGDVETVNKVSKFSLDCDLGIDGVVLNNISTLLTDQGCDVTTLRSHMPFHEALRSRSKAARRRTKYDVGL